MGRQSKRAGKPEDLPVNTETLPVEEGEDEVNQGAVLSLQRGDFLFSGELVSRDCGSSAILLEE